MTKPPGEALGRLEELAIWAGATGKRREQAPRSIAVKPFAVCSPAITARRRGARVSAYPQAVTAQDGGLNFTAGRRGPSTKIARLAGAEIAELRRSELERPDASDFHRGKPRWSAGRVSRRRSTKGHRHRA